MQFNVNEIPVKQLQLLGLEKKDIHDMPPSTWNALMSGNRTSLIRFNNIQIPGLEKPMSLDAKLSLVRNQDNTVRLNIHPISNVAKNIFDLSNKEQEYLKNSEVGGIDKKLKGEDGKIRNYLISLDKETNEYVAIDKEKLNPPLKINGVAITEKQRKDLIDGNDINVDGLVFKLDASNENGISGKNPIKDTIKSLEFAHSKYSSNELAIDLLLLTMGMGHFMMIGHLANFLVNSTVKTINNINKNGEKNPQGLENKQLRESLAKLAKLIQDGKRNGEKLTPKEIQTLVENHVDKSVEIGQMPNNIKEGEEVTGLQYQAVDENKTAEVQEEKTEQLAPGLFPSNQPRNILFENTQTESLEDQKEQIQQEPKKNYSAKM